MSSSSSTVVTGTQCLGSSTLDQRMELAGFSSRGRCVGGSSARSIVRSLAWLLNCFSGVEPSEYCLCTFGWFTGWTDSSARTFSPFHVTRHLAAWTNSDFGNFETWCDDCDHCPGDWKRLTELAHSRLEVPLENCDGSRNQAQEETEEVMSQVTMWVSMLRSCLLPLELLGVPLVDGQHPMAGFLRAPHLCRLDAPGTLETELYVIQQLVLDLETSGPFGGSQFALKLAALPQRPAHVDPHTASMRSNAHSWSNPPATFRWRVRFPYHDDVTSPQHSLGSRSSTNRVLDADGTPRNLHPSLQGHRQDQARRRRHWSSPREDGVQSRTLAGEGSSLNGWTVDS